MNCITCINNLYLTLEGNCVSTCPNDTFTFKLNYTCLNSCPNNYEAKNDKNTCELINLEEISLSDLKSIINNNISEFLNSSFLINASDYLAVILSSDDMEPKDQIKLGISAVDLGNCTQSIKLHYNISEEEKLIILNIETKNNNTKKKSDNSFNLGKNNEIEVFDFSGRKLDLTVCKEEIKILKYIGDVEEIDIQTAKSLSSQGIDVFNASNNFFNDLCHKYDNNEGKDIIINDRRKDLYQNVTFCQEGCYYSDMDYELKTANCKCYSNFLQEINNNITEEIKERSDDIINFKTIKKSFISNLLNFNFEVIFCYNLVFDLDRLSRNIGFYCMLVMLLLQFIFLIIFLSKKLKPIKIFMLIFKSKQNNKVKDNLFPPKRVKFIESKKINSIIKKNNINENKENTKDFDKIRCMTNIKIKQENESNDDISQNKLKLINNLNSLEEEFHSKYAETIKDEPNTRNERFDNNHFKNIKNENNKNKSIILPDNFNSTNNYINNKKPFINLNNNTRDVPFLKKRNFLFSKKSNKTKDSTNKKKRLILDNKNSNEILHKINSRKYKKHILYDKRKNDNNINRNNRINIRETIPNKDIDLDINLNQLKLSITDEDIQDMDYEEAIFEDKRSYLKMYWSFLVDSQIILGTFCTDNYLNLLVIKLSFLTCTFQISFFLNALFYTDDYISDAYHNDGVLDFVSGLPKSIYSFIATLITTNLLKILSNSKSELMKIIREKSNKKNYLEIINLKLMKLRKKLIAYFILVFSLGIISFYYVSSFCAVYVYSQKYWFFGCLESFAVDSLVALMTCLFLALMRFLAIKKRIKYLYIAVNLISIFL